MVSIMRMVVYVLSLSFSLSLSLSPSLSLPLSLSPPLSPGILPQASEAVLKDIASTKPADPPQVIHPQRRSLRDSPSA
jgi:hypothetical protein